MALQMTVDYKGLMIPDAYCKVVNPYFTAKDTMHFSFVACTGPRKPPLFTLHEYYNVPYVIGGADPYAQAYSYLKALPDCAGAVDC